MLPDADERGAVQLALRDAAEQSGERVDIAADLAAVAVPAALGFRVGVQARRALVVERAQRLAVAAHLDPGQLGHVLAR